MRQTFPSFLKFFALLILSLSAQMLLAAAVPRHIPLPVKPDDVIATGNEWIALPTIRAADGALTSFNVLSMRDRGLLEVLGERGTPVLQPYFRLNGKNLPLRNLQWELLEFWIPVARMTVDGVEVTLTYCAPPGARAAFLHMTLTNRRTAAAAATLGVKASWGALNRVTYTPVELRGTRTIGAAPWVDAAEVFSFVTHDTQFAWSLIHRGSVAQVAVPPLTLSPALDTQRSVDLGAGETAEADFVLGAGLEEFSAPHNAKALWEQLDRNGAAALIAQAAEWCRQRTRTTGQADLDLLMNRNFLFTALYAWGRTMDTEQFVGVTSRSPLYYVSAAYWDRDAMLWSFPGLLDIDPSLAREALEYAFTTQLRNTGIHSRFIDGVVLEDGFQLDEASAPLVALSEYVRRTGDEAFLASHRAALLLLRDRLLARRDPETGLYSTLQDSQDEYQKKPFLTYDNVLCWRALLDLAALFERLRDPSSAQEMTQRAEALKKAILHYSLSDQAPGSSGSIFVCATDGKNPLFADVPPGSLMKLPALGFVSENDPVFLRTYDWLHSQSYQFSYSDRPSGLPGSYRLPITTSWSIADHLALTRGRERALKILRTSGWDGGIVSEGLDPSSAVVDYPGRAFATAAGYVAHAICQNFCQDHPR
ncbi:MAG: glycoside hydrolase family 125 protein [Acidobacteriia bacterium]|nr:glycoside hydrolase family 125 protein [Terriglobia bacterium]